MPELPEVETVRRGLARLIVGRTIRGVSVGVPKVVAVGPETLAPVRTTTAATVRRFTRGLLGRRVLRIRRRAKVLVLELSGEYFLLIHLKMSGQLIVQRTSERIKAIPLFNKPGSRTLRLPHAHTHVTVSFRDGTRLYYNDVRRFGYLRLVRAQDLPRVEALRTAGIEPLERLFTPGALHEILAHASGLRVKALLLDQRKIAGIGNIYADEILYRARIRPTRRVGTLTGWEQAALYRSIGSVLTGAIRARGSSVGDFLDARGAPGRYGLQHRVYGRAGQPCKRCGTTLKRTVVAGRGTVYCPRCQK